MTIVSKLGDAAKSILRDSGQFVVNSADVVLHTTVGSIHVHDGGAAIRHPLSLRIFYRDSGMAGDFSTKYYPTSLHNGSGDAVRHCYWAALLCRDLGWDTAGSFLDAHEEFCFNDPLEKAMDLHNNQVGLQIGSDLGRATDVQLQNATQAKLHNGSLLIIDRTQNKLVKSR